MARLAQHVLCCRCGGGRPWRALASSSALDTVRSDSAICDRNLVIYLLTICSLRPRPPPHWRSSLRADLHLPTRKERSSSRREDRAALREPPHSIATLISCSCTAFKLRFATSRIQPRFARHTLASQRKVYGGVGNVCMMMGRVPRCANNIDRSSCRYSSRRILSTYLHHRISTAHRKHAIVIITTSTGSLHLPIRPSVAIPSDSTTSLSLLELRTIFKPLRSRNQ